MAQRTSDDDSLALPLFSANSLFTFFKDPNGFLGDFLLIGPGPVSLLLVGP